MLIGALERRGVFMQRTSANSDGVFEWLRLGDDALAKLDDGLRAGAFDQHDDPPGTLAHCRGQSGTANGVARGQLDGAYLVAPRIDDEDGMGRLQSQTE